MFPVFYNISFVLGRSEQCFGGACCLHLQGGLKDHFILLFVDHPEHKDSRFLRKPLYLRIRTTACPEDLNFLLDSVDMTGDDYIPSAVRL
jgi:hypothetical protein